MIALLQRVSHASVAVDGKTIAEIQQGLLVFVAIEKSDDKAQADRLLQRLLGYRLFSDADDKMNLSIQDLHGGLLLVPQFTLAADTHKGLRPSFSPAAEPRHGRQLFDYFAGQARKQYPHTACGRFGADMQVSLTNDGPVTFWLQVSNEKHSEY
ncbi:D-aminoacyl-tRNA deacylase [Methylophaga sp. OBS4]|uniref:D-aminoacyl-tRNA deacylase n=1 Tax=Methylophaga sp. OBS4 TaxID=2991935 RepID=UPI00224D1A15|nr:D-aminoacyl-tRNA deacylase [Methylophaga sp. OBS4]MCX4188293.1 D-aminoacyl-tRNA deacylase [Methylophaga sp. OBS4]